jgi:hypothetical protein
MLKSIVFVAPTGPLSCACSCVLSDETASVPLETSIASRNDRVASGAESSAVVLTVIVDRSGRSSSSSTRNFLRRRDIFVEKDGLIAGLSLDLKRVGRSGYLNS